MIFLTKQEKQEYIREQAIADGEISSSHFRCPVCDTVYTTVAEAAQCCADFDDEDIR
jgi:hypothetical protein